MVRGAVVVEESSLPPVLKKVVAAHVRHHACMDGSAVRYELGINRSHYHSRFHITCVQLWASTSSRM